MECIICANEVASLRFLHPCRHEFCEECVYRVSTMVSAIRGKPIEPACPICRKAFSGCFDSRYYIEVAEHNGPKTLVLEGALETEYPTREARFELGWTLESETYKSKPVDHSVVGSDEFGTYIDADTKRQVTLMIGGRPMMRNLLDPAQERKEVVNLGESPRVYPLTFDGRYFTCLWQEKRGQSLRGLLVVDREASVSRVTKLLYPLVIFTDKQSAEDDCVRFTNGSMERYPKSAIGEGWTVCGSVAFKDNIVLKPFTDEIMQLWDGARIQSVDAWTCTNVIIARLDRGFVRLPML
jgi:hypothetical protein